MIKNLIFDFGKVLVNHDLHAVLEHYFKEEKEAMERCMAILASPEFTEACDRGIIPLDELIREAQHNNPLCSEALRFFRDNYLAEVTEIEGMREVLSKLKAKGFKLYGLSNWCSDVYEVMHKYEIFNLLVKPEKEIYLRLCERYGLEPAECLFTDDRVENVEGAKSVGMNAVLFTSPENYAADVERICAE